MFKLVAIWPNNPFVHLMFILTDLTCTVLCEHDKSVTFSHVSKFETLCKLEASQQHDCCLTVFAVLKDSK